MSEPADTGLETLLGLDGITYRLNEGYWVKFEAHSVDATEHRPHGETSHDAETKGRHHAPRGIQETDHCHRQG